MADRLAAARALFDPEPGTIYLDAATYGLPPRPTVAAMHQAIDDWQAGRADWVTAWDQRGEACRAAFATLIGAATREVALVPSVSVGVGTVAARLRAGDEVLLPADEFTSVAYPLLVAAERVGARVRFAPFDRLAEQVSAATTLVACSLVQSQSGNTADLAAIIAAARRVGALVLVDATHAVPFVPLAAAEVDFVVCAAYKHLLCPRGVAFLYVAERHWSSVPPLLANWRSTSDPYGSYYGGPLEVAADAARFDVSLAWFAWAGAAVSLGLLVQWQAAGLLGEVVALTRRLATGLGLPPPRGSVLSVPLANADAVRAALARSGVKAAVRAGSVRLSPHVYTTTADIDRTVVALTPHLPRTAPEMVALPNTETGVSAR